MLRTDALGYNKRWARKLWIGGSVVPPKRRFVCVCFSGLQGVVCWGRFLECARVHVRETERACEAPNTCINLCLFVCVCMPWTCSVCRWGIEGQMLHDGEKVIFWTLFLQVSFQGCWMMWPHCVCVCGGGSIITALAQTWAGHDRNSEVREGERQRERVKVREMPDIKPSPVSFGETRRAVKPGFGSETGGPCAKDSLHKSPQWWPSVAGRGLLRLHFPPVPCEHEHDNNADMWTEGWGCGLPAPRRTIQLDCNPSWKGKRIRFSAEFSENMKK